MEARKQQDGDDKTRGSGLAVREQAADMIRERLQEMMEEDGKKQGLGTKRESEL